MDNKDHHLCHSNSADELEDDTFFIIDKGLVQLLHFHDYSTRSDTFDSSVCRHFREILIKYPCHVCNKTTIEEILEIACKFEPKLLCVDFLTEIVNNTCLNKDKLNWKFVKVIVWTIKKFLNVEQDFSKTKKLMVAMNVLPMARMLLSRYIVRGDGDSDRSLLEDVLDILRKAFCAVRDYRPDERLAEDLIKSFPLNPWKVFFIVWFVQESTDDREEYSKFWKSFTMGIHESCRDKWKSDKEFAHIYVTIMTNYPNFGKALIEGGLYQRSLIEVLRHVDIIPSRRMLACLQDSETEYLAEDLVNFYSEKVRWVLTNQRSQLNHDGSLFVTKTKEHYENQIKLQLEKANCKNLLFLEDLVNTMSEQMDKFKNFDLDFINDLIKLTNYDHINYNESFRRLIYRAVSSHCSIFSPNTQIVTSEIPRTIWGVINNLHEDCLTCGKVLTFMNKLLDMMTPDVCSVIMLLDQEKSTKLAASIPYVVRDKTKLFQMMYLDGFALLLKQLEQGKDVESLYMLGQVFRSKLLDVAKWETIPCRYQPIHSCRRTEGTSVFVLGDGTRIRAKTSRLVNNSEYFAYCFNKMSDAQASREEVHMPGITAFQFNFIVRFITAEPSTYEINFDMEMETHMALIYLCHRLQLQNLLECLVNSLRWHHMTEEMCAVIHANSLSDDIQILRKACVNFAIVGGVKAEPNLNCLQYFFKRCDKDFLIGEIREWIRNEYESMRALLPFDFWANVSKLRLEKVSKLLSISEDYPFQMKKRILGNAPNFTFSIDEEFMHLAHLFSRENIVEDALHLQKRCQLYSDQFNENPAMPF